MIEAAKTSQKEKLEFILDTLKEANGKLVKADDLCGAMDVTKGSLRNYISKLRQLYPTHIFGTRHRDGHSNGWYWIDMPTKENEAVEEEPAMSESIIEAGDMIIDRYPDTKNDEGYADPTAYAAMKSFEPEFDKTGKSSEIWSFNTASGSIADYLVVADRGRTFVTAIPAYRSKEEMKDPKELFNTYPVKDTETGRTWYCNFKRLGSKPIKYLYTKEGSISKEDLFSIRANIAAYLELGNIDWKNTLVEKVVYVTKEVPVEVPVEKVVEKIVEVPIERETIACRNGISEEEVQKRIKQALTEQAATIYRDILEKFLAKGVM